MSEYDANGDGFVNAAELAAEWDWTEDKAQGHIDSFDADGDGQLNASECAVVMSRIEAHLHAWFLFRDHSPIPNHDASESNILIFGVHIYFS